MDLAPFLDQDTLRRAIHEAQVRSKASVPGLRAAAPGRPGAAKVLKIVEAGPARTRSELEDRFLALLHSHRLPRPHTNVRVAGFEVDALFDTAHLIVELDGERVHGTEIRRASDRARDAALAATGYRVIRLTWDDVVRHPRSTARRLRQALS